MDVSVEASGFTKEKAKEFEDILKEQESEELNEELDSSEENTTPEEENKEPVEEQVDSDHDQSSVVTGTSFSTATGRRRKKKTLTVEDIKDQVKRDIKKKQFSKTKDIQTAKRNTQKGRDQVKLRQKSQERDYDF